MDCQGAQFNVQDITGYSVENEIAISTHCISNLLKTVVFGLYLGLHVILLLVSIVLLFLEFRKDPRVITLWNLRKRIFTCLIVYCIASIGIFSIFISGTFTRYKYFLFPFLYVCVLHAGIDLVYAWFHAASLIEHQGHEQSSLKRYDRYLLIFYIYMVSMFIILLWIGAIAGFENPRVVNWFIAFTSFHYGVCGLLLAFYIVHVGKKLVKQVAPALGNVAGGDKEVSNVYEKVRRFVQLTYLSVIGPLFTLLIPIWMGLSATATDPGLDYYSYYIYFADFPTKTIFVCLLIWFANARSKFLRSHASSEKHESRSIPTFEIRFPSFTVDELNTSIEVVNSVQV